MDLKVFLLVVTITVLGASKMIRCQGPPPLVQTQDGSLEGTNDGVSRGGRKFSQFRGIQYAVIEERFTPSVETKPWDGIKKAEKFGPSCENVQIHGDENCLFLNIYTPTLGSAYTALLPVAVYIHGGSFQNGTGNNYGPNYFMDEDIVLVTINYRLGVLGFLSTGDEASPGNYGLKDQVMALRWIQKNIQAFNGDKNKVTIMGQSAGGASVTYHLTSPMSTGLFHGAIVQSGTFMAPWAFTRKPLRYAQILGAELHCEDTNSTSALVACLRTVPATTISNRPLARNLTVKFFEEPIGPFGPTIEPAIEDGANTFLSVSPYELLASQSVNKVPVLTGVTKEEGVYFWAAHVIFAGTEVAMSARAELQANFNAVAPAAFYFDEKAPSDELQEISGKVQEFYFGPEGFSLVDMNATLHQLAHLYSDRLFVASSIHFMNLYAKVAPTYPYLYAFNKLVGMEFGWEELHRKYSLDATHSSDLDMLYSPFINLTRVDPVHDALSKSIIKLWASFITDGAPTATFGSERNFPPIGPNNGLENFYQLDVDTEMVANIFEERMSFWESLNLSDDDFINCNC